MDIKTERFEMRLEQGMLDKLDAWRTRQSDLPSRAEAVRRLMEAGLNAASPAQVSLSDGEKLILLMLGNVHTHLKIRSEIDPKFLESVILGGHHWALRQQYLGILHGHVDDYIIVSEVRAILDMWFLLESGYRKLSKADKARIEKEAAPFGKSVLFRGFDGNNESQHYSIARFLIDDLESFTNFKDRDLNSHMPLVGAYRRMLVVFQPIRSNLMHSELKASQVIEILNAQVHPEHKKAKRPLH